MSRRSSTLRKLRHALAVGFARAALKCIPRLSLERTQALGGAVGALISRMPGKRRERVRKSLLLAFPEKSARSREAILRESYRSTGKLALEGPWLRAWNEAADMGRYRLADPERFSQMLAMAKENGRGLILYGAHIGAMEMALPFLAHRLGLPVAAMAARPKIPELAESLKKMRELSGVRIFYRGDGATGPLRHLLGGGVLIMMVDHNIKGEGVELPFMGQGAHTLLAPARLALQASAAVNTMYCLRETPGRFLIECGEPIIVEKLSRDPETNFRQQAALAAEYTKRIEEVVRRFPGQFLWMHRRWQKRSGTLPFPRS